ncbi:MAG: response regulator transcription factor [Hyphomicrobium denitrificans]|mgnify:CR=1 FL=1|nr:response regulator transcription factor [Hyphomicrobium denitrificans]
MMNAKRDAVLVADDHSLYRTGLSYLLKDRLGFNTVVEAATFDAALDRLSELDGIGLALFDLAMPGVSGPESLGVIKETYPDVRVAIVSGSEERSDVLKAVATGLGGYVPKSLQDDEIVAALRDILDGRIYVPRFMTSQGSTVAARALPEPTEKASASSATASKPISPRQRDVLECVRRGLSNKEIARELEIAEGTVKIHLAALFSHFGARNRTELATRR